jgi:hypothetical protein
LQQINDKEWISDDGEWIVFTDGKVKVYHLEERIDLDHADIPKEVQIFLDSLE